MTLVEMRRCHRLARVCAIMCAVAACTRGANSLPARDDSNFGSRHALFRTDSLQYELRADSSGALLSTAVGVSFTNTSERPIALVRTCDGSVDFALVRDDGGAAAWADSPWHEDGCAVSGRDSVIATGGVWTTRIRLASAHPRRSSATRVWARRGVGRYYLLFRGLRWADAAPYMPDLHIPDSLAHSNRFEIEVP